jgi:hypothetical protein
MDYYIGKWVRQNNIKVDVDTTLSTPMITAAREAATAFCRIAPGISLFHAILIWWASYGINGCAN